MRISAGGRRFSIGLSLLLLTSCGPASTPANLADNVDALRQRALNLPVVAHGATCPASGAATLSGTPLKAPAYGFGQGPVYLTGQTRWYAGEAAVVMVDPAYGGTVVIRGRQLDGSQSMPLVPTSAEGDVAIFRSSPSDWRVWNGQLSASSPGCFGLQADGTEFSELIVFQVLAGSPPPG